VILKPLRNNIQEVVQLRKYKMSNNNAFADQNGQFYGTYGIGTTMLLFKNQIGDLIMQVVCRNFGATDGYTEQNQNGDVIGQYVANGTNDRSTLTQTGDRNTNTSNLPEIIIYRRH
jgi:hypothetical protein